MDVEISGRGPADLDADLLAIAVVDGVAPELPEALAARIARLAERGDLPTEAGRLLVLDLDDELPARRLALAGAGERGRLDQDALRTAAAVAGREAARLGGTIGWALDAGLPLELREQARAAIEGVESGAYDPGRWKTRDGGRPRTIDRLTLANAPADLEADASRFATVARWTTQARDLTNAPGNILFPEAFAVEAERIAGSSERLTAEVLWPEDAERLGMGALLAVGAGSANGPRMIVLRYEPPSAPDGVTLGLVGKALTFDAGGLSIKPALRLHELKGDKAGGSAVVAAMGAIAELEIPLRTIAVVAAAENLLGERAFRPGDILRAMSGTTIEVTNTDAEGRLVLADALWHARGLGATHVIDLATLTGAMALALGDFYAGYFANDDEWRDRIAAAAEASGDHAWQFPLHPRYRRYVDSTYADIKNSSELREGSPVLAAEFLQEFAGEGPWAHVDMAGPGFLARSRGDYLLHPGGSGYGVRLIAELAAGLAG
jgi:leucyl aminopeptidase